MSDNESSATPHIDEDEGLWVPPRFREFDRGIVFRTPRGTIQHFGSNPLDPYYGMITADDFGDADELYDCRNPQLAPNKVSIKPYGEDAQVFDVEQVAIPDGGEKDESEVHDA